MRTTRTLTAALALASLLSAAPQLRPINASAAADCEGAACASVTLTFDEAKLRYRAQNNSPDRWVRVTASNLAASASACLAPARDATLVLKSIVGSYRADFAEEGCGAEADDGR